MAFYCSDPKNKGLGDWIEGRTHTFGLDKLAHWWATKVLGRVGCKCPMRRNQLNSLYQCDTPTLTIGMATYNDYEGVWATVTSIVDKAREAGLLEHIEILVVDQSPDPITVPEGHEQPAAVRSSELTKNFIETWVNGTDDKLKAHYVKWNHKLGTTLAKNMVFQSSRTEWTMCIDSHVILTGDSLRDTYRYICENRYSYDIYHGVLLYDGFKGTATHLEPEWRGHMWGTWATDPRGIEPSLDAFEIPAAAGWSLLCRRDAWLGYHPLMQGFGGEETFLQKWWVKNGRKAFCLPCFRGIHRFGRTAEMAPVRIEDKIWNATMGLLFLQEDLTPMRDHFAEDLDPHTVDLTISHAIAAHTSAFGSEAGAKINPAAIMSIDDVYQKNLAIKSDINEHLPTLRGYAKQCDHVTEFGTRTGVSTSALLAGEPKVLHTWDTQEQCSCKSLAALVPDVDFQIHVGDVTQIKPIEETDLLFIDTYHNAAQMMQELSLHADQARKYIIMHDTTTFWEHGESYDGTPQEGLKVAVEPFLDSHPEWSIKERYENNNGLLVLEHERVRDEQPEPVEDSDNGTGEVRDLVSSAAAGRARLRRRRSG